MNPFNKADREEQKRKKEAEIAQLKAAQEKEMENNSLPLTEAGKDQDEPKAQKPQFTAGDMSYTDLAKIELLQEIVAQLNAIREQLAKLGQ